MASSPMTPHINKLKWLTSLVFIFGGFAVYEIFKVLAIEFADKNFSWLFKIIAEFGLFSSVMVSVGHFHHWLIAAEEHRAIEKNFHSTLVKYVDSILLNSLKRNFSGMTAKELDFSDIMHRLAADDYVYWLITFDPRYKHHCRELENALNNGTHFRMIIIKEGCTTADLRAREITGYRREEFSEYAKLFKLSLEDVIAGCGDRTSGTLGVLVSDGLPSVPLFIIVRNKTREVEIYSSFYLSEPVGRMPYLKWKSTWSVNNKPSFETENWNMCDLFIDYFEKRWQLEREKVSASSEEETSETANFVYGPKSAKRKCLQLFDGR